MYWDKVILLLKLYSVHKPSIIAERVFFIDEFTWLFRVRIFLGSKESIQREILLSI